MSVAARWGIRIAAIGCFMAAISVCSCRRDRTIEEQFFNQPLKAQMTNFRRYDLQKQYEIYIYGNQIREPPAVYLAEAFAMEGRAVVGMLQEKLLTASDDLTVTNIVVVFGWISFLKSYDVAANKNLVDILADKIGHVRDPYLKQTCKREMAKIVGGSASQQESGNH